MWSSDCEEESEAATEEEPETATLVVKESVRQETDGEDQNDESEEGEELDAWAGCATVPVTLAKGSHAPSAAALPEQFYNGEV